jgi:hypothetical protein
VAIDVEARAAGIEDVPVRDEQVTVGATGVGLDPPDLADVAFVQVLSNPVRMRVAGGEPTATRGHSFAAGDTFDLEGGPTIRGARFIREAAADATLEVTYFVRKGGT